MKERRARRPANEMAYVKSLVGLPRPAVRGTRELPRWQPQRVLLPSFLSIAAVTEGARYWGVPISQPHLLRFVLRVSLSNP
jgi:hypothetical protein